MTKRLRDKLQILRSLVILLRLPAHQAGPLTTIMKLCHFPRSRDEQHQLEMLVGITHGDEARLFKAKPPEIVSEIRDHVSIGIGVLGASALLDALHNGPFLKLEATGDLSAYILKHVKDQIADCDGYSDIILLGRDGNLSWPPPLYVEKMEQYFTSFDAQCRDLLLATVNGLDDPERTMDQCLQEIRRIRHNMPTVRKDAQ